MIEYLHALDVEPSLIARDGDSLFRERTADVCGKLY